MISFYLTPITTNDFWIQLKVGQLIKQNFEIPKTILFAFTPATNNLFVAHEWLPSLIFSIFYDSFGYNFMIFLKLVLYSISFFLAYLLSYRINKNPLFSLFIASLCMFAVNYRSFMRPESFSYILFLSQLNLLWCYKEKKSLKYLFYYLILNIIWVNSHGSFLLSLGFPTLLAASLVIDHLLENYFLKKKLPIITNEVKMLTATSFICALSSLINPLGFKLLVHSYNLGQNDLLKRTIFEWKPMLSRSVMNSSIFTVFLIFITTLSLVLLFRFLKLRTFTICLLVIFGYLSFEAQRHLAFFAVASVWPLAIMLKGLEEHPKFSTFLSFSLITVLLLAANHSYQKGNTVRTKPGFYHSARIPERTLDYIRASKIKGNTLNTYSLGGQLLFHFYPKIKIGIDSRIDAYGVEYARKYRSLIHGKYEPLRDFLETYSINNIIINNSAFKSMTKKGAYEKLKEEGWKLSHRNSKVVILKKTI